MGHVHLTFEDWLRILSKFTAIIFIYQLILIHFVDKMSENSKKCT